MFVLNVNLNVHRYLRIKVCAGNVIKRTIAVQLVACTVIVYYLGIQEQLHSLLNWVLSGVSLLSVAEMIVGGIKLYLLEHKVDELKEKVEATQEGNHIHNN